MPAYFLDSSALVKRYSAESGTSWLIRIVRPVSKNFLSVVSITGVEIVSALTRKRRGGNLSSRQYDNAVRRFEREWGIRYFKADVTDQLVEDGIALTKKYGLRGYDAVQLAAGRAVTSRRSVSGLSPLIFVSADHDLINAALAEGFVVENPDNHT